MRRWAVLLALAATLGGCTFASPPAEDAARAEAPPMRAAHAPPRAVAPALADLPRLDVTLDVEDRWLRPGDALDATASAPSATRYEWYLASRNPVPRGPEPPRASLEPGRAVAFALDAPGRHAFVADGAGARLGVTVTNESIPLRVVVRLVGEGAEARFVPPDAFTGVGATLVVERPDGTPLVVRSEGVMTPLGLGERLSFTMTPRLELGDYDVVVVARAGGDAWGEAAARVIHDHRKPDARASWTHSGGFTMEPVSAGSARHEWATAHPLAWLRARVDVHARTPLGGAVRVALVDAEGTEVASAEGGALEARDLPAGEHAFVATLASGGFVEYRIEADAERVLVPPETFFNS